jgi:hypothetical protein
MDDIAVVGHIYRFLLLVRFIRGMAWFRSTYLDGYRFIISRTFRSRRAFESTVLISRHTPVISMTILTATSGTTIMILVVLVTIFATTDQVAAVARGL